MMIDMIDLGLNIYTQGLMIDDWYDDWYDDWWLMMMIDYWLIELEKYLAYVKET